MIKLDSLFSEKKLIMNQPRNYKTQETTKTKKSRGFSWFLLFLGFFIVKKN
jgi:hypothetical protein